jgi:hypothetical protein
MPTDWPSQHEYRLYMQWVWLVFFLPPDGLHLMTIAVNKVLSKFQRGPLKRRIKTAPTSYPSYPLLAPELHPVEHFAPEDYPCHGLARLLTSGA